MSYGVASYLLTGVADFRKMVLVHAYTGLQDYFASFGKILLRLSRDPFASFHFHDFHGFRAGGLVYLSKTGEASQKIVSNFYFIRLEEFRRHI